MNNNFLQNNIKTIYCNLPNTISGFTVASNDDYFTIVLNENLSYYKNLETYLHEINHIIQGDFNKKCPADIIESLAHNN